MQNNQIQSRQYLYFRPYINRKRTNAITSMFSCLTSTMVFSAPTMADSTQFDFTFPRERKEQNGDILSTTSGNATPDTRLLCTPSTSTTSGSSSPPEHMTRGVIWNVTPDTQGSRLLLSTQSTASTGYSSPPEHMTRRVFWDVTPDTQLLSTQLTASTGGSPITPGRMTRRVFSRQAYSISPGSPEHLGCGMSLDQAEAAQSITDTPLFLDFDVDIPLANLTLEDKSTVADFAENLNEQQQYTSPSTSSVTSSHRIMFSNPRSIRNPRLMCTPRRKGTPWPGIIPRSGSSPSTGSSWVTVPTLTNTPPTPQNKSQYSSPPNSSWEEIPAQSNFRPTLRFHDDNQDRQLGPIGMGLHPLYGSGMRSMVSSSQKQIKKRHIPRLQASEDVFLTKDPASAKRLRENYALESPRFRGYAACKSHCCSCRLHFTDFQQSPTRKRFKSQHILSVRGEPVMPLFQRTIPL